LNRNIVRKSINTNAYKKNEFKKTWNYIKLNFKYPEYNIGFQWILRARCGYKFNARVDKAANIIEDKCPECCPCCYIENENPQLKNQFF